MNDSGGSLVSRVGPSGDLAPWMVWLAVGLALASFAMLLLEMRQRQGGAWRAAAWSWVIALTGLLAVSALLAAVLRPARVTARESVVGARVVVLADTSRSMALPANGGGGGRGGDKRFQVRDRAIEAIAKSAQSARLTVLGFADGAPLPFPMAASDKAAEQLTTSGVHSDLGAAIRALAASPEERPAALVVVSDGRLDDPPEDASDESLRALGDALRVPIDTVAVSRDAPADASVRHVSAAGAAVAHVPLPLRVEVGCVGLPCDDVTVTARELRDDGPPTVLASGVAHAKDGKATLDLTVTLERAGARIVEVAIAPPSGDTLPENDRRLVTFHVARERVRVLHVAGRPTDDTRALRQWLKGDASIDVVAFFILRTPTDDANASQNELSLIPFPVDELFTEHLPSFDAVVLQDFDAQPYGLVKYLPNLARYVRGGGGLVMVGGQNSFVAGGYAGSPLADVLPVELDGSPGATSADTSPFTPVWTPEGRAAPLLSPLREIVGDELPDFPGTNVLGPLRRGGVALWSHPTRTTRGGAPMPVLAIGEEGDGRSIAMGIDGAWELEFSRLGSRTAGRGHGALWDGLLGWLMRDPRFEPAQMEVPGGCTAGLPWKLRARLLPGGPANASNASNASRVVSLDVTRIDRSQAPLHVEQPAPDANGASSVELTLPPLDAGGYTARLRVGSGEATRYDFACEAGGDEWADSRPGPALLERLAAATGGRSVSADAAGTLPLPKPTVVSAERRVTPVAPPWSWTLAAAVLLGVHWIARRRGGLS
jgi:uncharacterized membrane protein